MSWSKSATTLTRHQQVSIRLRQDTGILWQLQQWLHGTCRVADIFAQMNNKMSGDLKKIQVTGKYFVEIWKAIGMESIDDKVSWLCSHGSALSANCSACAVLPSSCHWPASVYLPSLGCVCSQQREAFMLPCGKVAVSGHCVCNASPMHSQDWSAVGKKGSLCMHNAFCRCSS